MNDKKVINGLRNVRRQFFFFAIGNAMLAGLDYLFLSGSSIKWFVCVFLVSIIIEGTVGTFIDGYEKEN